MNFNVTPNKQFGTKKRSNQKRVSSRQKKRSFYFIQITSSAKIKTSLKNWNIFLSIEAKQYCKRNIRYPFERFLLIAMIKLPLLEKHKNKGDNRKLVKKKNICQQKNTCPWKIRKTKEKSRFHHTPPHTIPPSHPSTIRWWNIQRMQLQKEIS